MGVVVPFVTVPESGLKDKHRKKAKKDAHNSSFLFLTDFFPFFSLANANPDTKNDVLMEKRREETERERTAEGSSKGS